MSLFDRIVNETAESGIAPLELKFTAIHDCYNSRPLAYRTETELFCSAIGKMNDFIEKIDSNVTGKEFSYRNIIRSIDAIRAMEQAGRKINYVSISATTSFLTQESLYEVLKDLFDRESFTKTDKICLEFTKNVLSSDREAVRKGLADLKVLGVKTMISGFASDGFPTSALLDVAVDSVILAPEITALSLDRNKPGVLSSLIRFIKSMDVAVIAEGVRNDDELRELNKAECFGFIPADDYSGRFVFPAKKRDLTSALSDKEDV
ncbi:MAG: EAL domain-containing protein [Clostridia bacterium]|nr:EAL domain-containing protein [Clostridia bacterium]